MAFDTSLPEIIRVQKNGKCAIETRVAGRDSSRQIMPLGLTQRQLADQIGMEVKAINQIIYGRTTISPKIDFSEKGTWSPALLTIRCIS